MGVGILLALPEAQSKQERLMDLNLQPPAAVCRATHEPFTAGQRVVSFLVRDPAQPEILRHDVAETALGQFSPGGQVVCRWVHAYKPRRAGENPDRALKLTAETLFLTLADPATESTVENARLLQFLALMLERKRVLKPRGRSADGERLRLEHVKTKQVYEVPAGELTPEFFVQVQSQLSVLVGEPSAPAA